MSVGPRCVFCVEGAARWVHRLDVENVEYAPRDIAPACVRCERLYQAGDDDALVAVWERAWEQVQPGVDYNLRIRLAAYRRADLGAIPLTEWWPPGVAELVARGFTPLEDLTGDFEIASEWPEPHRRWCRRPAPGGKKCGTTVGAGWFVHRGRPCRSSRLLHFCGSGSRRAGISLPALDRGRLRTRKNSETSCASSCTPRKAGRSTSRESTNLAVSRHRGPPNVPR